MAMIRTRRFVVVYTNHDNQKLTVEVRAANKEDAMRQWEARFPHGYTRANIVSVARPEDLNRKR